MKLVQFGLRFSPNVGDGIISECLSYAIRRQVADVEVVTVDISGRQGFGETPVKNRTAALAALAFLPAPMRQALVTALLSRLLDRAEPAWRDAAKGAALAIVGGGQIFSDADLNFCLKINRVAKVVRAARVPVAIYAVGVSSNWSPKGQRLFMGIAETDLRAIGIRDAHSLAAWRDQAASARPMPSPELTPDPGLLAADCYGPPKKADGRVGICVTSPRVLAYHAERGVAAAAGAAFLTRLAQALVARGHRIAFFCNGAEEDRRALALLGESRELSPLVADGRVELRPAPATPAELALTIAGFSAVIAHRLHACIVAYSYGLPIVGLGWDRKVESFLDLVGAQRCFVGSADAKPSLVATHLEHALTEGIDPEQHARVIRRTWEGIDLLLRSARPPDAAAVTTRQIADRGALQTRPCEA